MAAVNGDNYAKIGSVGDTSLVSRGLWNSPVLVQCDEYEASSLAADSTINVAYLPKGAKFLGAIVSFDALGSGVTVQLGDSGDDDRYLAATDASSAGSARAGLVDGVQYEMTADTTIFVKVAGAAATGTIKTVVLYSL